MTATGKLLSLAAASAIVVTASAQVFAAEPLRICAAKNELPFSASDGSGFENHIARIVADEMGREAEFVWADDPGISFADMSKRLGELWRGLSDAEKARYSRK